MGDRVPTHLVVGPRGAGKTAAVASLLRRKPAGERWAVLVAGAADAGVPPDLVAGAGTRGVSVRAVAGGCGCCARGPELAAALHLLLTEARPDRLVVEVTGPAHPPAVRAELLRAGRVGLGDTLGVVTATDYRTPAGVEAAESADVLVLNKVGTATPAEVAAFQAWAGGLQPAKWLVVATSFGRVQPGWLRPARPVVSES